MSKHYYIAIGYIGVLLFLAFTILSYIDKTIRDPSKTLSDNLTSVPSSRAGKQPYHILSSKTKDDRSSSPSHQTFKDKTALSSSPLNLKLVGITVFGEKSSVIIEDLTKGTQGFYRLGDIIKGFEITKILKDIVTLTRKDHKQVLLLAQGGAPLQSGEFARKVDEDSWVLSAYRATEMVRNINQYAGQVLTYQHRENGEPSGFRIRHLKKGNDFEKMGIENNDIIKRVNGLEVSDLSGVLKAVYQLSDETTFHVEVERNNQTKTLNYQLDKNVNALVPIISSMLKIPSGRKGGE